MGDHEPERRIAVRDGVRLSYVDEGSGPVVVLLHGFPDSLRLWDEVAARLVEQGRRVVRLDQRGFGESSAPDGRSAYRMDELVADVVAVLDDAGINGPVDLAGHDWGALIGWGVCLARPERVRRHVAMTVGHPSAYRTSGLDQKWKGLYVVGFLFAGLRERLMSRYGWLGLRRWGASHPDIERCIADCSRPGRMTAGLNWYRANVVTIFTRRWEACRVPTLGVWCSRDDYLSEEQVRRSERHVAAEWRYQRLDGAGHWAPLERPAEVADLLVSWFAAA